LPFEIAQHLFHRLSPVEGTLEESDLFSALHHRRRTTEHKADAALMQFRGFFGKLAQQALPGFRR
jgi:hypothetical protein